MTPGPRRTIGVLIAISLVSLDVWGMLAIVRWMIFAV